MVASEDGRAIEVYPAVNAAASPLRYEIDPADQYRIEMAIEGAGRDLGAIYHSHTRSEPYPSQTDVNLAFHPAGAVRDRRAGPAASPTCGPTASCEGRSRTPSSRSTA